MGNGNDNHDRKRSHMSKREGARRQPPEQEQGYAVTHTTYATNPYDKRETREILSGVAPGQTVMLDPNRIRTMHQGFSNTFSDGRTIADTAAQMQEEHRYPAAAPPVHVAAMQVPVQPWQGEAPNKRTVTSVFSEDHRRLEAARQSGVPVPAQFLSNPTIYGNYTTTTVGKEAEVRQYQNQAEGAHQRRNKSTLPEGARVYKPSSRSGSSDSSRSSNEGETSHQHRRR